jgi:hypothetical protein
MSCERYAQAIEDHACGADLAAAAAAHLDSCMRCAAGFEAQRRALEDLEAELQRGVAIDPSPAFAPGVRAGIDRASSAGYRLAWLAAPLAVGAAIAIAVLVGAPGDRPAGPATPPKPAPAPASSTIARATPDRPATVPAVPVPVADRAATDRRRRSRPIPQPAEPEIIVPPGQARALARYMALVRRGTIDAAVLIQPPAELQAPADLVVDPLTVAPIGVGRTETITPAADGGTQKE